ncbi:MAG: hypothetical protein II532_05050 [Bacteroidales bacterium]|nr:hypothetical protein [Bacteroidales bacterium]
MNSPYLLLLAAIAALCIYFSKRTKHDDTDTSSSEDNPSENPSSPVDHSENDETE